MAKPKSNGPKTGAGGSPGSTPGNPSMTPSQVGEKIRSVGGWRAETLAAVPAIEEDCKWIKPANPLGVPTWSCGGIVCTGEAYKEVVKLTFARGASLKDPQGLFNASLEGNTRRAIDIHEDEVLDAKAFKGLIVAAVAENQRSSNK